MEVSKLIIHMVCSLDGFIAKADGDISWMHSKDQYEPGIALTKEYIDEFLNSVGCYFMGANTYEHALKYGWPYGDKPVVVMSQRKWGEERDTVTFDTGELKEVVKRLKSNYKSIWMVGGAKLTKDLLLSGLADEIVITMVPYITGGGLPFFDAIGKEIPLHLKDTKVFNDGMVELTYQLPVVSY